MPPEQSGIAHPWLDKLAAKHLKLTLVLVFIMFRTRNNRFINLQY